MSGGRCKDSWRFRRTLKKERAKTTASNALVDIRDGSFFFLNPELYAPVREAVYGDDQDASVCLCLITVLHSPRLS